MSGSTEVLLNDISQNVGLAFGPADDGPLRQVQMNKGDNSDKAAIDEHRRLRKARAYRPPHLFGG